MKATVETSMGTITIALDEGKAPETISGEKLRVYGNDQVCDCYLPWEDRHETVSLKNGFCEFPDFKRSLVVRFTR